MKKRAVFKEISSYVNQNKLQYFAVVICVVLGMVTGTFVAVSLSEEGFKSLSRYMENFVSAYNLQPVSKVQVFKASVYNNIKSILFLWFFGLWVGFIPFTLLQMGIKGYKLGFSGAFLIQAYKGKGVLFALLTLMPQLAVTLPALVVYSVFTMKYAMALRTVRSSRKNGELRRDMYLRGLLCIAAIAIVALISSLLDAFVVPPLLKPICSFLI